MRIDRFNNNLNQIKNIDVFLRQYWGKTSYLLIQHITFFGRVCYLCFFLICFIKVMDDYHLLFIIEYSHLIMDNSQHYLENHHCTHRPYPNDPYLMFNGLLLQQIIENQNYLQQKIAQMEQQSTDTKRQLQELKSLMQQKRISMKNIQKKKIRKNFAKDKICSYENCSKKYSSQIALRAHVRRIHHQQNNDSDEFVL